MTALKKKKNDLHRLYFFGFLYDTEALDASTYWKGGSPINFWKRSQNNMTVKRMSNSLLGCKPNLDT